MSLSESYNKIPTLLPMRTLRSIADEKLIPATDSIHGLVKLNPTYFKQVNDTLYTDRLDLSIEKIVVITDPYIVNNTIYKVGDTFQCIIRATTLLDKKQKLVKCVYSIPSLHLSNIEVPMDNDECTITVNGVVEFDDIVDIEVYVFDNYNNRSNIAYLHPVCRQICKRPTIVSPIDTTTSLNLSISIEPPVLLPSLPDHAHQKTEYVVDILEDDTYTEKYRSISETDLLATTVDLSHLLHLDTYQAGSQYKYTLYPQAELEDIVATALLTIDENTQYIFTIDRRANIVRTDGKRPGIYTKLPQTDVLEGNFEVLDMISSESLRGIYHDGPTIHYSPYNAWWQYAYVLVRQLVSGEYVYSIYRVDYTGAFTLWTTVGRDNHIPRKFNHAYLYRENTDPDYNNDVYRPWKKYFTHISLLGVICEDGIVEFYEPFARPVSADNQDIPYGIPCTDLLGSSQATYIDMDYVCYKMSFKFLQDDNSLPADKLTYVHCFQDKVLAYTHKGYEIYPTYLKPDMVLWMRQLHLGYSWLALDQYSRFLEFNGSIITSTLTMNPNNTTYYRNKLYSTTDLLRWVPLPDPIIYDLPSTIDPNHVAIHLLRKSPFVSSVYYGVASMYSDDTLKVIGVVTTTDMRHFYFCPYERLLTPPIPIIMSNIDTIGSIIVPSAILRAIIHEYHIRVHVRTYMEDLISSEYSTKYTTVYL